MLLQAFAAVFYCKQLSIGYSEFYRQHFSCDLHCSLYTRHLSANMTHAGHFLLSPILISEQGSIWIKSSEILYRCCHLILWFFRLFLAAAFCLLLPRSLSAQINTSSSRTQEDETACAQLHIFNKSVLWQHDSLCHCSFWVGDWVFVFIKLKDVWFALSEICWKCKALPFVCFF